MNENSDKNLGSGLKIFGWIYFVLSFIGASILFILSSPPAPFQSANIVFIVYGIIILILGIIVIAFCYAFARILKQNVEILGILNMKNEPEKIEA